MSLIRVFLVVLIFTVASVIESSAGGTNTDVSPGDEAITEFFLAVGDYYRIPQAEVINIRGRGVPPYEIPVVLFIAKRAHVTPEMIMDFRLRDNTWLYTALRFGFGAEIFYVPVRMVPKDSLFAKAYESYKHKPKKEWRAIVLSDDDIVNLVNLKMMSEHYGYPPEKIIKMRSEDRQFVSINDEIRKQKEKIKSENLVERNSK